MIVITWIGCHQSLTWFGEQVGKPFDKICIKTRLDKADAAAFNLRHPQVGAVPGDRLFNRDCSKVLQRITRRDR